MNERQPEITELGVVDPLRLPAQVRRSARRIGSWPLLARIFVALAIADAALRAAQVLPGSEAGFDLGG